MGGNLWGTPTREVEEMRLGGRNMGGNFTHNDVPVSKGHNSSPLWTLQGGGQKGKRSRLSLLNCLTIPPNMAHVSEKYLNYSNILLSCVCDSQGYIGPAVATWCLTCVTNVCRWMMWLDFPFQINDIFTKYRKELSSFLPMGSHKLTRFCHYSDCLDMAMNSWF